MQAALRRDGSKLELRLAVAPTKSAGFDDLSMRDSGLLLWLE